ncbi:MAG: iron chelate uptake ABC transporter family permease subunit [Clostridium sp.]|nr:iron chelate uptake ABC transporter family permease subunit [Clostridium sp.]
MLVTCLVLLSILSLGMGVKEFSIIGFFMGQGDHVSLAVISRIPRLVSILVTGASLSIAGLIMQTITSNKFVSPATAGTMEWCKLGVIAAMLLAGGQSKMIKILFAFIVALAGTMFFMYVLNKIKFKNMVLVPLVGMMLGNVVGSITSYFAYKYDIVQNMSSWLQGNFSLVIKGNYELLYIGIPFLFIAYLYANKFTIAGMGDGFATSLGLNHKAIVTIGMVIVAFITSVTVVTIGSIPFIGLIVPNIVAMYKGDNLKNTLFDTAIFGALFVLICDMIGRNILAPYEVSISVVISIVGSAIFLFLITRKKNA